MREKISILIFLTSLVTACVSLPQKKNPAFDLSVVEKIQLGTSQDLAERALGKPDVIDNFDDHGKKIISWMYIGHDDGLTYPQTMLFFDGENGPLRSKNFLIDEKSPEAGIDIALKRYSFAKFEKVDSPWCGHYQPSEVYYVDESRGLEIVTSSVRNDAEEIWWRQPSTRRIASIKNMCAENPPINNGGSSTH